MTAPNISEHECAGCCTHGMRCMGERRRYTDEERASFVAMLVAEGYPDRLGALKKVSEFAQIHTNVLRRWWKGTQNPPPTELVTQKRADIAARLKEIVHQVLDLLPDALEVADTRELITALGVSVDKLQLLEGKPTERKEISASIPIVITKMPLDEL